MPIFEVLFESVESAVDLETVIDGTNVDLVLIPNLIFPRLRMNIHIMIDILSFLESILFIHKTQVILLQLDFVDLDLAFELVLLFSVQ